MKCCCTHLEVLPAYWGIETDFIFSEDLDAPQPIWKYYPPTGVLKLHENLLSFLEMFYIWKYYPPTGVLKQIYLDFRRLG